MINTWRHELKSCTVTTAQNIQFTHLQESSRGIQVGNNTKEKMKPYKSNTHSIQRSSMKRLLMIFKTNVYNCNYYECIVLKFSSYLQKPFVKKINKSLTFAITCRKGNKRARRREGNNKAIIMKPS